VCEYRVESISSVMADESTAATAVTASEVPAAPVADDTPAFLSTSAVEFIPGTRPRRRETALHRLTATTTVRPIVLYANRPQRHVAQPAPSRAALLYVR